MPTKTKATQTVNPVRWFEIPVTNLKRAKAFYEKVIGVSLTIDKTMGGSAMAWFPMKEKAGGAPGTLIKGKGYIPSSRGTVVYFMVQDIDAAIKRVTKNGGKILLPKFDIGQHGFIAHFKDTEGNRVALHANKV